MEEEAERRSDEIKPEVLTGDDALVWGEWAKCSHYRDLVSVVLELMRMEKEKTKKTTATEFVRVIKKLSINEGRKWSFKENKLMIRVLKA
eukprot:13722450-Ditylum_brightwellii.AAC.1